MSPGESVFPIVPTTLAMISSGDERWWVLARCRRAQWGPGAAVICPSHQTTSHVAPQGQCLWYYPLFWRILASAEISSAPLLVD